MWDVVWEVVNQVGPEAVAPLYVGVVACGMWHVGRGISAAVDNGSDGRKIQITWKIQEAGGGSLRVAANCCMNAWACCCTKSHHSGSWESLMV